MADISTITVNNTTYNLKDSEARTQITTHTHGNISNAGAITSDTAVASGDKIVVTDSSASSKLIRTGISFDGSTTTKALTPKGTWETFTKASDLGTMAAIDDAPSNDKEYARKNGAWTEIVDNTYTLPIASSSTLGGIKVGTNLSINGSGVLSATNTKYTASTTSIGSASAGTAIKANNITAWSTGTLPTLGTAISADDITSWSTGTLPKLGTALAADDITNWSTGTLPTLGTAISADDITSWSTGTLPTLGSAIPADDITSWSAGTLPSATVQDEILTITFGTLPSLQYTAKSIPNITGVGTLPTLDYTSKSIPNVTSVGTLPALEYTARSIPNVTSVGTLPALEYTAKSIPNVTGIGTLPSLTHSEKNIPNITVTAKTVVTGITES